MMKITFWVSLLIIMYNYLCYPLLLFILSKFRSRPIRRAYLEPSVTMIISAHNEEGNIRQKLENTLSLEYPSHKLQVIVTSDHSTDLTDRIVLEYGPRGVELLAVTERKGKEYAQRQAIMRSKGEILVFTDASILLDKYAVESIVSNFHDLSVGCVSCEDRLLTREIGANSETLYTRYEMWIRRLESQVGSVVGLSGFFFAARRELCQLWPDHLASDFFLPVNVVKNGYRAVSDPKTVGYYQTLPSIRQEFARKKRTILRGITVLSETREILNPFQYGFFAIQIFSHKLVKWLVPVFLVQLFVASLLLVGDSQFYGLVAVCQIMFYVIALLGLIIHQLNRWIPFRLASFFVMSNFSILVAWMKYLRGERIIFWEPSRRSG